MNTVKAPARRFFPVIRMQVKEVFYYPDPCPYTELLAWNMRMGPRIDGERSYETIDKKGRVVERISHVDYEHRVAYSKPGRKMIAIPSYRHPVIQPLFPYVSYDPVLPSIEDMLKDVGK